MHTGEPELKHRRWCRGGGWRSTVGGRRTAVGGRRGGVEVAGSKSQCAARWVVTQVSLFVKESAWYASPPVTGRVATGSREITWGPQRRPHSQGAGPTGLLCSPCSCGSETQTRAGTVGLLSPATHCELADQAPRRRSVSPWPGTPVSSPRPWWRPVCARGLLSMGEGALGNERGRE